MNEVLDMRAGMTSAYSALLKVRCKYFVYAVVMRRCDGICSDYDSVVRGGVVGVVWGKCVEARWEADIF